MILRFHSDGIWIVKMTLSSQAQNISILMIGCELATFLYAADTNMQIPYIFLTFKALNLMIN